MVPAVRRQRLLDARQPQCDGDGIGGVPGDERIVYAFGGLGKTGQPAGLPEGRKLLSAAGKELMCVALMADVKDQPVAFGVEAAVQRDGQLDDAEVGGDMAACLRKGIDKKAARFRAKAQKFRFGQSFDIVRAVDAV